MSPEVATRRRRLGLRLAAAALIWSLGLLFTALVVPLYNGQTTSDANGLTLSTATYVQRFGVWTLVPLVLPALAAIATLVAITGPSRLRAAPPRLLIATHGGGRDRVRGQRRRGPAAGRTAHRGRAAGRATASGRRPQRPRGARRERAARSGAAEGEGA